MKTILVLSLMVLATTITLGDAKTNVVDYGERPLIVSYNEQSGLVSFFLPTGCGNIGASLAPVSAYRIVAVNKDGIARKENIWQLDKSYSCQITMPADTEKVFVCLAEKNQFVVQGEWSNTGQQSQAPCSMSYESSQCSSGACSI